MKNFIKSIRITIAFCILFSVCYVLILWVFGQFFGPGKGNAETITLNGKVVGAANVGQAFTKDIYFWGRPSAADYKADSSAGSNKGPTNEAYLAEVEARVDSFLVHHPYLERKDVPAEMVTASGSGMIEMLNMQINTWFGGVGVGWMNYFTFIIIAVFISGLMVGRTPEFLCHKVEAREMKVASMVALLHPFVILVGTALAAYLYVHAPEWVESEGGWLNNPGFHGLSEMLYEFTSVAANNGSGFEGLGDNTWFWNISCGIVLILSRFIPIVGQVAIAGLLAQKTYIPESAGTLKTDTVTFGVMTFAVIFIVAALSFFPAHALSTIAEHFSL
jgi:K+-transporting ATPase KdpC subunit